MQHVGKQSDKKLPDDFIIPHREKWACFGRQDGPGKSIFSETLRGISTICGVFKRAQWADSSRHTAAKLRSHLLTWSEFSRFFFFERLMYFSTCYRSVLYLLNCKLLFCLPTVALLRFCEFSPNVTCVRMHACSRITVPHAAGS